MNLRKIHRNNACRLLLFMCIFARPYVVPILDLVYSRDYNICYFRKVKHVKIS